MIRIVDGCIVCGLCEAIEPRVFRVEKDGSIVVRQLMSPEVQVAVDSCPVNVIQISTTSDQICE